MNISYLCFIAYWINWIQTNVYHWNIYKLVQIIIISCRLGNQQLLMLESALSFHWLPCLGIHWFQKHLRRTILPSHVIVTSSVNKNSLRHTPKVISFLHVIHTIILGSVWWNIYTLRSVYIFQFWCTIHQNFRIEPFSNDLNDYYFHEAWERNVKGSIEVYETRKNSLDKCLRQ